MVPVKLSKLTWTGIVLLVAGIAVSGSWAAWVETRITTPIDLPVSLKLGHAHTEKFKVNLHHAYIVEIEAKKRIPFDELNCLLGVTTDPANVLGKKCEKSPVVNVNWTLRSGNEIVGGAASSGTTSAGGWGDETVERILGSFEGESGRSYVLDFESLADGSALAATDPHLKVRVSATFDEDMMVGSLLWFWLWVAVAVAGLVLLSMSAVRSLWRKKTFFRN